MDKDSPEAFREEWREDFRDPGDCDKCREDRRED